MQTVYFDHASTTRLDPRVLEEMMPFLAEQYGNPSSHYYELGHRASAALEEARARVASMIGAGQYPEGGRGE